MKTAQKRLSSKTPNPKHPTKSTQNYHNLKFETTERPRTNFLPKVQGHERPQPNSGDKRSVLLERARSVVSHIALATAPL